MHKAECVYGLVVNLGRPNGLQAEWGG